MQRPRYRTGALGIALGPVEIGRFASGEIYVRFLESVRGCDACLIQAHGRPVNEMVMEHRGGAAEQRRQSRSAVRPPSPSGVSHRCRHRRDHQS
ncbi:MAG: ribose-phosphate pyrophosphokinase-like domain-containing protein [Candidatus Dormibacteria bacterium]